jgi:tRNA(adenine34) deaminase
VPAVTRNRKGLATLTITTPEPAPTNDDAAMALALAEARFAADRGEVPVGAICIVDGQVVARRHNEREHNGDPTAHAEMLVLRDAAASVGEWRLRDATVVVTLEPCPMCAGALVAARVGRLVFGATDPKAGACGTLYNLCADPRLNHEVAVTGGVRSSECGALLTSFFADRRNDRARPETFGAGQSG